MARAPARMSAPPSGKKRTRRKSRASLAWWSMSSTRAGASPTPGIAAALLLVPKSMPTLAPPTRGGYSARRAQRRDWLSIAAAFVAVALVLTVLAPVAADVLAGLAALLADLLAAKVAVMAGRETDEGDRNAAALDVHEGGAGRAGPVPDLIALHPVPAVSEEDLFVLLFHHLDAGLNDDERRRGRHADGDVDAGLRPGSGGQEHEREDE